MDVADSDEVSVFADSCLSLEDLSARKVLEGRGHAAVRRRCKSDVLGPRFICGAHWSHGGHNDAALSIDPHVQLSQSEPTDSRGRVQLSLAIDQQSELQTAVEAPSLVEFLPKVLSVLAFLLACHPRLRRVVHRVSARVAARRQPGRQLRRSTGACIGCLVWVAVSTWGLIFYLLWLASERAVAVSKAVPRYKEGPHADWGSLGVAIDGGVVLLVSVGVLFVLLVGGGACLFGRRRGGGAGCNCAAPRRFRGARGGARRSASGSDRHLGSRGASAGGSGGAASASGAAAGEGDSMVAAAGASAVLSSAASEEIEMTVGEAHSVGIIAEEDDHQGRAD